MKKYLVGLVALAMLAAACGEDASAGTTDGSGSVTIEESRPVTINGAALPLLPDAGGDPAVGLPMPEVVGSSFDGSPVEIVNDGRPKVLLILAHW